MNPSAPNDQNSQDTETFHDVAKNDTEKAVSQEEINNTNPSYNPPPSRNTPTQNQNPQSFIQPQSETPQDIKDSFTQIPPQTAEPTQTFSNAQFSSQTTPQTTPLQQTSTSNPPPQTLAQEPTNQTPQVFISQTQSPHEALTDKPKSSRKILFLFIFLFLITLIFSGLGGLGYAVAYEKIKLDKYPDLQKQVSYLVMDLSFMPKTAKFLLAKTALAHQDVTKHSFDVSAAVDSADLASSLGISNFDIQAKGAWDYTNPKNVFGTFELSVTKDFNIELRKKEEMVYFKLNKLPAFLLAFLGISSDTFDPFLDKWVSYDTTPLDTEARKTIQEDKEVDPLSEEFINENFEKFVDDEILSKMQLGSDIEEGHDVYKITLNADGELIDYLGKKMEEASGQKNNYSYPNSTTQPDKLSDYIKGLTWEMYIDKESYYTRKVVFTMDIKMDSENDMGTFSMGGLMSPISSDNSAKIAVAVKLDKFGQEVIVEEPAESMTFDEFSELLSQASSELYGGALQSYQNQFSQARDSIRKFDISILGNALEMYYAENFKYPATLGELTGTYLTVVPNDPDGGDYYYRVSTDGKSYDLCANMETPPVAESKCPEPTFNYHISSQERQNTLSPR